MDNPAIVFNCSYNGLSILQELGSRGIDCIAMDCSRGIGTFTKYARYVKSPDPLVDEEGFINKLYDLCIKSNKKPVLFPTNDEWAYAISKHKSSLQKVAYPCVADFDVIEKIINKDQFYVIGEMYKYLTPKIYDLDETEYVEISFPIVAKPIYKAISADLNNKDVHKYLSKRRLTLIESINELEFFLEDVGKYKDLFLFQEYVPGLSDSMYTVGVYADKKSNIRAIFSGKKVRGYPPDIGDNIVGESCAVPEYLIDNTNRVVKEMRLSGIAEFEYKKDSVTGIFRLIEVNARSWSWIGITPHCGVNLPLIAYQDMIGVRINNIVKQEKQKVRHIRVYQDFFNCLLRYRLIHPPWVMSLREWLLELKSCKRVYAEIHKQDYLIAFISIFYLIAKVMSRKE